MGTLHTERTCANPPFSVCSGERVKGLRAEQTPTAATLFLKAKNKFWVGSFLKRQIDFTEALGTHIFT